MRRSRYERAMKIVRLGLLISAAVVALILLVGLFLPSAWTVERSTLVQARPESIAPFITDLRRWEQWAAWSKQMDPEATWTFFGATAGAGAKMAWRGPKMGIGLLHLTAVEADLIRYEMQMEGSLEGEGEQLRMKGGSPGKGSFTFAPEGGATRVTWRDEGEMGLNLAGRYFVPMLERMLGEHFEIGLGKLKQLSEEAAQAEAH
jgi:hypothetical protein